MPFLPALSGIALSAALLFPFSASADIQGPPDSLGFGAHTLLLPNRNIAVAAPGSPGAGGEAAAGAVYLYSPEGVLISTLRGAQAGDAVGSRGLVGVPGSNRFLVLSPEWSNGSASAAGAVTLVDGETGLSGVVGADNSVVGSTAGDRVGEIPLLPLADGRVALHAPVWDNAGAADAGALHVLDPSAPVFGPLSAANSLVGSTAQDQIGRAGPALFGIHFSGLEAQADGGLVVRSPMWNRGSLNDAGAITYVASGQSAIGVLSTSNSLTGSSAGDSLGFGSNRILGLAGGGFVLRAPEWNGPAGVDQGAVILFDRGTEVLGEITPERALIGAQADDRVGSGGVTALPNGALLVSSPDWSNGSEIAAGALTWIAPGATAAGTVVGAGNSLVGSQAFDRVSELGAAVLSNGNAVIASPSWANGDQPSAGAVTWIDADAGISGPVSAANSLVGEHASSRVGQPLGSANVAGVVALSNGHFLVQSSEWRPTPAMNVVGAVTWGDGESGSVGMVSAANSLVGSISGDLIGAGSILPLAGGDALMHSPRWSSPTTSMVGAVTWVSGTGATVGALSAQNSWVGSASGDLFGVGLHGFADGSALVTAYAWNDNAGAVLRIPAGGGAGVIGPANSQVGQAGDGLGIEGGFGAVLELPDGSVLVSSPFRQALGLERAGSVHRIRMGEQPVGSLLDSEAFTGSAAFDQFSRPGGRRVLFARPDGGFIAIGLALSNALGESVRGGLTVWGSNDLAGQRVDSGNTLFGESQFDFENAELRPLERNTYLLTVPGWDHQGVPDAGRVIWFDGTATPGDGLDASTGRFGSVANDLSGRVGAAQVDWAAERLVLGLPASNRVIFVPLARGGLFENGFEGE